MALMTTSQMPKDNKPAAKKAAKKASPDAPPVQQPHAGQPEKRATITDKKSAVKKPRAGTLAPADIKPADVPKADAPPAMASSTTKITRGVSDVDNSDIVKEPEAVMLESPVEAIKYYKGLLKSVDDLFRHVQIPEQDIDPKNGAIHEDSVIQEMNRLISLARGMVWSTVKRYIVDGLLISSGAPDPEKLANLVDLSGMLSVVDEMAYDLASSNQRLAVATPALRHTHAPYRGGIIQQLPNINQGRRTLLTGVRMLLLTGAATENDYLTLAENVQELKQFSPALSVWVEFRLKRVLAVKHTREEAAVALIDTLLSTSDVRICSTTSGKSDPDGERFSYLAMWREIGDPGVMHYARLSSNTISTFALTGHINADRFSAAERTLLYRMVMNTSGDGRGITSPVGGM